MQLRNQIEDFILNHESTKAVQLIEENRKIAKDFINVPNEDGLRLLEIAVREGLEDVTACLCLHGASITLSEVKSDDPGAVQKFMDQAIAWGHLEVEIVLDSFISRPETIECAPALFMYAIRRYSDPEGLSLPSTPNLSSCQGLLELAAFLNKPAWAEKILSLYPHFQLRHCASVRTPAYWAARNNDEALFKKLCLNNDNHLLLTVWQLKEDGFENLYNKYFTEEAKAIDNIFERIPADTDKIDPRYNRPYAAALRNNQEFIKKFNYEIRREVMRYALAERNFVALHAIQQAFKSKDFEFWMSSLDYRSLVRFDRVSQNHSYYEFILRLDPKRYSTYIFVQCKVGLLNYLMSSHIIKGGFNQEEMVLYNALSKRDELASGLAEERIRDRKAFLHKIVLFKDLGLPWEKMASKSLTDIKSDKLLDYLFQFLIDNKKERSALRLVNKRFQAIVDHIDLSSYQQINQRASELKDQIIYLPKVKQQLEAEIKTLVDFKQEIQDEIKKNVRGRNCYGFKWGLCWAFSLPATFVGNVFSIIKLKADKAALISLLSAISTGSDESCFKYYDYGMTGCGKWHNHAIPDVCSSPCDEGYGLDLKLGFSITTSVLLAGCIVTTLFLPCFYDLLCHPCCDNDNGYDGCLSDYGRTKSCCSKTQDFLQEPLDFCSPSLQQKIPHIASLLFNPPFLFQPIELKTNVTKATNLLDAAIARKRQQLSEIPTSQKSLEGTQSIFQTHLTLFAGPKEIKESKVDIVIEAIYDEPPKVSHIGSLNDNLRTPLLDREREVDDRPRRSACPCVIL